MDTKIQQKSNSGMDFNIDLVEGVEDSRNANTFKELLPKLTLYLILFLQGLGTVLPWNVLITASDFFQYQFQGSIYQNNFQNYFSVIFMGVQLLLLVPAIVTQRKEILYQRIMINILVVTLVFAFLLILPFLKPYNLTSETNFGLTMIPLVVCGAAGVFAITDVYGLASMFPPIYIQGVMSGQAIGGVAVALIQFVIYLTALNKPEVDIEEKGAATLARGKAYFGVALAISLFNLGSLIILPRLTLYNQYVRPNLTSINTSGTNENLMAKMTRIIKAFKRVWLLAVSVILVFTVTLSIFPSITAAVRPSNPSSNIFYQSIFVSIHFVIFNAGDLIGRLLLGISSMRTKSDRTIFILSILRCIFFFIFLTSNLDLGSEDLNSSFPRFFNNDAAFFILLLLFSISSGYLGSGSMVLAPSFAKNENEIPAIGNVMSFSLTMGLALGSFLSFGLRAAVCKCNSFAS